MKYLSCLLFATIAMLQSTTAQRQLQLQQVWTTDSILRVPESVLYDAAENLLFVSLIGPTVAANKEGKGGIAKLSINGSIIDTNWITGLNCPKGLGRFHNNLYAADGNEVAVIDIKKGVITKKIPVSGAVFLNDITIDAMGIVYVSDSRLNKIHRIEKGQVSLYLDNITNANGLLAVGEDLYALSAGELLKINAQKQITRIAGGMDKSTDGLVQIAEDEFIVSCWNGVIYDVFSNGRVTLLSDFRAAKMNTADLGYHAKSKTLYVPTFWKKTVIAYRIADLR